MTREERIEKLQHLITCMKCKVSGKSCDDNCPTQYDAGNMGEIIENLEEIAKVLEQEPCEDAISRQAVLDEVDRYIYKSQSTGTQDDFYSFAELVVKQLPSVTPQPKTDTWSIKDVADTLAKHGLIVEQEPCEYAISRQAVIDTLTKTSGIRCDALKALYDLPHVKPQPKTGHWIPVSERLPNNDEDVLVCYQQGGMEVVYYHIDNTFYPTEYEDMNETGWFNEDGDALYFEPIAWMPLPEPHKAESEDKE